MTIAYWMVLLAGLLPYAAVTIGKARPDYDNHAPRAQIEQATPWRQRAYWAQLNQFEAFPLFAAGIVIAHQRHASQYWVDALAIAFLVVRVIYLYLYIADRASLRSVVWAVGLGCAVATFFV